MATGAAPSNERLAKRTGLQTAGAYKRITSAPLPSNKSAHHTVSSNQHGHPGIIGKPQRIKRQPSLVVPVRNAAGTAELSPQKIGIHAHSIRIPGQSQRSTSTMHVKTGAKTIAATTINGESHSHARQLTV